MNVSRKAQPEASCAGLLDAAQQCFSEQGYETATVAAILKHAGMARSALYHYFPSGKREIVLAAFDGVNEPLAARASSSSAAPIRNRPCATRRSRSIGC